MAEFALEHPELLENEAVGVRYYDTWKGLIKLPSFKAVVPAAVAHARLLHAVDCFPRGGWAVGWGRRLTGVATGLRLGRGRCVARGWDAALRGATPQQRS